MSQGGRHQTLGTAASGGPLSHSGGEGGGGDTRPRGDTRTRMGARFRGHQSPRRQKLHPLTPKHPPSHPHVTPPASTEDTITAQPGRSAAVYCSHGGNASRPKTPWGRHEAGGWLCCCRGARPPPPSPCPLVPPPGVAARPQGTTLGVGGGGSAACLWGLGGGGPQKSASFDVVLAVRGRGAASCPPLSK